WGELAGHDDAGPRDADVGAEAVERLLRHLAVTEGGLLGQPLAPRRSGEPADGPREAVADRERAEVLRLRDEVPPEVALEGPEVGRLPGEGRAVDLAEAGEEVGEVAAEVAEERPLVVEAEELPDDLTGEHLAVGQRGSGAALAQRLVGG